MNGLPPYYQARVDLTRHVIRSTSLDDLERELRRSEALVGDVTVRAARRVVWDGIVAATQRMPWRTLAWFATGPTCSTFGVWMLSLDVDRKTHPLQYGMHIAAGGLSIFVAFIVGMMWLIESGAYSPRHRGWAGFVSVMCALFAFVTMLAAWGPF